MNEIKIQPQFSTYIGKWVQARHEQVTIERDLEMNQKITCEYYEDNNGVIGIKTLDHIDNLTVSDTEKKRLREMYKDFSFSRSSRSRYVNPNTFEPIEEIVTKDPQTGEVLSELTYETDYITERDMWQGIGIIAGIDKIAGNVYQLIEANIQKMFDNNLDIS